ncbi:MAG: FAD:protein FMN transferase [Myxococcota bacterium]|nr:FAD:protein FMN transferase [Myxococcota bacterium]
MLLLTGSGGGAGPIRRFVLPAIFVATLFITLFNRRPEPPDPAKPGRIVMTISGPTMGTSYTVKLVGPATISDDEAKLKAALTDALNRVNASMSTYRDDSEISRFNRSMSTAAQPVGDDMRTVLAEAHVIYAQSKGAFDATVGPLVEAWGFGPKGPKHVPSAEQLGQLLEKTGMKHLVLDTTGQTLRKTIPEVQVDLSAIAKGYGVDEMSRALTAAGVTDYLVEVGGELRASGLSPKGKPWRVGIEKPLTDRRSIQEVIALENQSMATSGDYRNYREVDGRRISHTIDPRSGKPIEHTLASVTVIAPNCSTADAWATALNVLGPDAGLKVARAQKLAALFMVRSGSDGFKVETTPEFEAIRTRSKGAQPGTK